MTESEPDMGASEPNTEAELERFRAQWKDEVARSKRQDGGSSRRTDVARQAQRRKDTEASSGPATARRKEVDYSEEIEPRSYHDLVDPESQLVLGKEGQDHDRDARKEPSSALEHYEHAVEKETLGNLRDSLTHYRKAFKLDSGVQEKYKNKYFPPPAFKAKPINPNPSNVPVTVPRTDHHSLHGSKEGLSSSLKQLISDFSDLRIEAAPAETNISHQRSCPLAELPEEILSHILTHVAMVDIASFARTAQVCKRLAYLVLTEEAIWKRVVMSDRFGFTAMHYDFACDIEGFTAEANDSIAKYLGTYDDPLEPADLPPTPEERALAFSALTEQLLRSTYHNSWRQLFRLRPRIRFNGCYISTVNYPRAGGASTNTLTWGAPVHIVTYFRYLRFFRDGTAISLLTTSEPVDVVHHLTKENMHDHHPAGSTLPSSVMRDALRGRWRLTGPASSVVDPVTGESETEGDLVVETEGVVPKYMYRMQLALAHAGKGARNNKLAWKDFSSYNRLTDDWAEFGLKNDKAFYWARVRSFGMGY